MSEGETAIKKLTVICGRLLDNEPIPMEGCDLVNCEKCKLEITKYVPLEDIMDTAEKLVKFINETEELIETTQNFTETPFLEGKARAYKELLEALKP